MFERKDLEALAAFKGDHTVVSLYLNLAPHLRGTPDAYRARLKGLLKRVSGRAQAEDIAALEDFFEKEFDWTGRSVAAFVGQGGEFWQVEQFFVPLRSTIHVGDKPFLMPLANLLDNYGSFSVALVDQQSIRAYYFHLGERIAYEKGDGEDVKRLKGGGGAAGRARGDDLSGYAQENVSRNLKKFASAFGAFCEHHKAEHLLLGGAETTLHHFKGLLAQPYRDSVEGMFPISMRASDSEVLASALELMQANEEAREARLVELVMTMAAKGANGVVRMDSTLEAIDEGRVQTLLLVEDAHAPEDIDPAIVKVVDYGGDIEFVSVDSPLKEMEGIGALLRY